MNEFAYSNTETNTEEIERREEIIKVLNNVNN